MKKVKPIFYDENKIYAFHGKHSITGKLAKKYKITIIDHIWIVSAGRTNEADEKGKDYDKFSLNTFTPGKQVMMQHFNSFSEILKLLNEKNVDLLVFDSPFEFLLWALKYLKLENFSTEKLYTTLKEQAPYKLSEIVSLYADEHFNIPNDQSGVKYGCDNCGWVYNDTKENRSFEDLGEFFVCPNCGSDKSNFSELK